MICPLLTLACQDATPGGAPLHDCIEKECAWWDPYQEACGLATIPKALRALDVGLAAAIGGVTNAINDLEDDLRDVAARRTS